MIKANDDRIEVGYIKELMRGFNLPSARVYKEGVAPLEDGYYIKDRCLMHFKNGEFHHIKGKDFNKCYYT